MCYIHSLEYVIESLRMQWYLFEWHPALTFIVTRLHHTHYCIKMTTAVDKMTTTASMYLWTTSMKQDTKLFRARLGKNHYQTGFLFSGKICRRWSNKDTFYVKWLDGVCHLFFPESSHCWRGEDGTSAEHLSAKLCRRCVWQHQSAVVFNLYSFYFQW